MTTKKLILLAVLLFVFALKGLTQPVKNFIDLPFMETSATVDTMVVPDRIYLNIVLEEKDTKGKVSVEELEAKLEETLRSLGIPTDKNLVLNDLASNFKKYFLKDQDILKTKSYSLIVEDAVTAGKVIIALEKTGISNVNLEKTEYSKIESLKLALMTKAVLKARKQAESMCNPLNVKVGHPIFISDLVNDSPIRSLSGMVSGIRIRGKSSIKDEYTPADIQFEKITVERSISVKFKIEN